MNQRNKEETLALVAGARTPFCKAGTDLAGASAADLATHVFREVFDKTGLDPELVDEVILGCAGPSAREANVARVAGLRAGVPISTPALTVMRNCASGMEALFAAQARLRAGQGEVFLVGGSESMSNFPLVMGPKLTRFFQRLSKARSAVARLRTLLSFRPSFLKPRIAIMEGLTDPITGLMMGNTAENVARAFGISRFDQDVFATRSHKLAEKARASGRLAREIAPLAPPPKFGAWITDDNGIREGQSHEALARLRPVFDKREGDVTVGNACQITDGAAAFLVMSQARAEELGLRPMAVVRGSAQVGLDPAVMGMGPAHAIPRALDDAGLVLRDLDLVEINEAFAAQVLGCQRALDSDTFCREQLGRERVGEVHLESLNIHGGAIALGHPIAASGVRIVQTLVESLVEKGGGTGVASLCIGGGQGQALVLEA